MSEREPPKYKCGDIVERVFPGLPAEPCKILDGPFEPGVQQVTAAAIDDYTYLIQSRTGPYLVKEGDLVTPDSAWEDCPGEHRCVSGTWQRNRNTYERSECPCRRDDD